MKTLAITIPIIPRSTGRKKGGSRKIGRNLKKCAKYRTEGRREKNKARRARKEAKRQERFRVKREIKILQEKLEASNTPFISN